LQAAKTAHDTSSIPKTTMPPKTGWWLTYPSEKYEFVSWEYYSQYMESHKIHVPNQQTEKHYPLVI